MKSPILFWFRHDLRIHDHPALHEALLHAKKENVPFLSFWIWDQRWDQTDQFGTPRMGANRAKFLLQGVQALQKVLEGHGQSLLLFKGDPRTLIPHLMNHFKATHLYASHHVTDEEVQQQDHLKTHIPNLHLKWSHTLFTPGQLPFTLQNLPDIYTQFRKKVEYRSPTIKLVPTPSSFPDLPVSLFSSSFPILFKEPFNSIVTLDDLKKQWKENQDIQRDPRAVLDFNGTEHHGLERVNHYLWQTRSIESYKKTRNGLIGADYSTKFSPWLSTGALSPRWV